MLAHPLQLPGGLKPNKAVFYTGKEERLHGKQWTFGMEGIVEGPAEETDHVSVKWVGIKDPYDVPVDELSSSFPTKVRVPTGSTPLWPLPKLPRVS